MIQRSRVGGFLPRCVTAMCMAAVLLSAVASARQDVAASEADDTAAQESDEVASLTNQEPGTLEPPKWGGPNAVENQLAKDAEPKQTVFRFDGIQRGLKPYFDFKQRLKEDTGFSFGMDYSAVYFSASESLGEDRASGGMFRLFGDWELTRRGTQSPGRFVYKVEHRHGYTDVPPSGFGLESGYVGMMAPPFSDQGWRWTNLYWHQRFAEGKGNVLVGFLDVTDYIDIYALGSPWLHFMNLAFSTGSASIPLPADAALGATAGGFVSDQVYFSAGIADSNGTPTDPFDGFDSFFDESEYFSHVEVGWTPSYERRYFDSLHLTLWHVDERDAAQTSSGWGVNASFTKFVDDSWMPFLRVGYADDGGSLLEKTVSGGIGYYVRERADLLGIGLNWGEPNADTFGSGRSDQYTAELFYRVQLSPNFAITPDLQFIVDPALNPAESSISVLGLRVRLSL